MTKVGFKDKESVCRQLAVKYFPTTREKDSEYVTNLLLCLYNGIFVFFPVALITYGILFFVVFPLICRLVG